MAVRPSLLAAALLMSGLASCKTQRAIHVVSFAPTGELAALPSGMIIALDVPLSDPTHPAGDTSKPEVSISPSLPFNLRVPASAARIVLALQRSPSAATEYTVTLHSGLATSDGTAQLQEEAHSTFRTPRNHLDAVFLGEGGPTDEKIIISSEGERLSGQIHGLGPKNGLHLRFRFPVSPMQLKSLARVVDPKGQAIPFEATAVSKPSGDAINEWVISPADRWPRDSELTLTVQPGLGVDLPDAGPLVTTSAQSVPIHTWGSMTASVVGAEGGACVSPHVVWLRFANPTACSALAKLSDAHTKYTCQAIHDPRVVRLAVNPALRPSSPNSLTIPARTSDLFGEVLDAPVKLGFTTCADDGVSDSGRSATILSPGPPEAPFIAKVRGAASVKVEGKQIALADAWGVVRDQGLTDDEQWTQGTATERLEPEWGTLSPPSTAAVPQLQGAQVVSIPVKTPIGKVQDRWRDIPIDLHLFLSAGKTRGAVLLRMTPLDAAGIPTGPPVLQIASLSEIGLSARISGDTMVILATRNSDGTPMRDVAVSLKSNDGLPVGSGRTGDDGLLTIHAADVKSTEDLRASTLLIDASQGEDESFLWSRNPGRVPDSDFASIAPPVGAVYSDRGTYRPGEMIHLHGTIRNASPTGLSSPAGEKAKLAVLAPDGMALVSKEVVLSPFGSFDDTVSLPSTTAPGEYAARLGLGWNSIESTFHVGRFRHADATVDVDAPAALGPGEALHATVRGKLPSGNAAVGMTVRWSLVRASAPIESKKYPQATFSNLAFAEVGDVKSGAQLANGTGKLDAKGSLVIVTPLTIPAPVQQREKVLIRAIIEDGNGGSAVAIRPVEVVAAKTLIGLKVASPLVQADAPVAVTVYSVDSGDNIVAGVPVVVTSRQRATQLVRKSGEGVTTSEYWEVGSPEMPQCKGVTSESGEFTCTFHPSESGNVQVSAQLADVAAPARSSQSAYVQRSASSPQVSSTAGFATGQRVAVFPDAPSVFADDRARVVLGSPYAHATALITVERESILWSRVMQIERSAAVELPTMAEWSPNVRVAVTLIRSQPGGNPGGAGSDPRDETPGCSFGALNLEIKPPAAAALQVHIKIANAEVRPKGAQSVSVVVRSAGRQGNARAVAGAEVNLWAVDEGVLALADYRAPELSGSIYRAREPKTFGVSTVTSSPWKIGSHSTGTALVGDRKPVENATPMTAQNPLAVWVGSALTDATGTVEANFPALANPGTFRVMATVSTTDNRFGNAEGRFVVTSAASSSSALARFMRPGDTMAVGVNLDDAILTRLEQKQSLVADGRPFLHFGPDASRPAVFEIGSLDTSGAAEVRVRTREGTVVQSTKFNLPVARARNLGPVSPGLDACGNFVFALTKGSFQVGFVIPGSQASDAGKVAFQMSIGNDIQTMEQPLPLLYAIPDGFVDASGAVESGSAHMELKLPDGTHAESMHVSVSRSPLTVMDGKLEALERGQDDSLEALSDRAFAAFGTQRAEESIDARSAPSPAEVAFAIRWIASLPNYRCPAGGYADDSGCPFGPDEFSTAAALEGMLVLSEGRGRSFSVEAFDAGRSWLNSSHSPAVSLAASGLAGVAKTGNALAHPEAISVFDSIVFGQLKSPLIDAALHVRMAPSADLTEAAALLADKELIAAISSSSGKWSTEVREAAVALAEQARSIRPDSAEARATIRAGGATLASNVGLGSLEENYSIAPNNIHGSIPVEIENAGTKPFYFDTTLTYSIPLTARIESESYGVRIQREFLDETGHALQASHSPDGSTRFSVHAGDRLEVRLSIDVDSAADGLVVEDPFAGGLEPIEAGDSHAGDRKFDVHGDRVRWRLSAVPAGKIELTYRTSAATMGTYRAPGAVAEVSHRPPIHGRSTEAVFEVLPK